jgi:DNA processing protein
VALLHWLALSLTDGIGPILGRRVIEAAGGVETACTAREPLLRQVEGIGTARAGRIAASLAGSLEAAGRELERAAAIGATVLCPDDSAYPPLLHSIPDPPLVLYVRGSLEPRDLHAVAIVGSRRCSFYGREQSERFAALLAGAGVTVVSGGARGVDSAVHRGALSHPQGRTLAVLGSGVNVTYPPENHALFDQIAGGRGAVISEFPIDAPPAAENFPRRNRIVSGISRGVLVVEADLKSGALITARCAADDHGRPVFALPGRVDNALSAGPHMLIRDGAILVTGLEEILGELGPLPQQTIDAAGVQPAADAAATPPPDLFAPAAAAGLSEAQGAVLTSLEADPQTVDQIIERSGQPAAVVLRELTFLTLRGLVRRLDGQTFALSRR